MIPSMTSASCFRCQVPKANWTYMLSPKVSIIVVVVEDCGRLRYKYLLRNICWSTFEGAHQLYFPSQLSKCSVIVAPCICLTIYLILAYPAVPSFFGSLSCKDLTTRRNLSAQTIAQGHRGLSPKCPTITNNQLTARGLAPPLRTCSSIHLLTRTSRATPRPHKHPMVAMALEMLPPHTLGTAQARQVDLGEDQAYKG